MPDILLDKGAAFTYRKRAVTPVGAPGVSTRKVRPSGNYRRTDVLPVYRWFPLAWTKLAEIPGTLAGKVLRQQISRTIYPELW